MIGWRLKLALRYLRARRREGGVGLISLISFLGIAAAVAVLVAVMGVMNGFRSDLIEQMLGFDGHAQITAPALDETRAGRMSARLSAAPGVTAAYPLLEGQALALGPAQAGGVIVRAVRGQDQAATAAIRSGIVSGDLNFLRGAGEVPGVAIGKALADRLGARVGDEIRLLAPAAASTAFGAAPREVRYRVAAVFTAGVNLYDAVYVFMPLHEAQRLFGRPDEVDAVEVFVEDPQKIDAQVPALSALAGPGALIGVWNDRNSAYFTTLQIERVTMRMILMLVVAIAAMNIVSGLVMLVKNKGRDVAVLRTMGARPADIVAVFTLIGALIGVSGALAGAAVGVLFCQYITPIQHGLEALLGLKLFAPELYLLPKIPAKVEAAELAFIVVWTIGMALVATLPPALRAARLQPVEALRYE